MENQYIIFQSGALKFLIGMEYIETIEQAGRISAKTIPVFDFGRICRLEKSKKGVRYMLILRSGAGHFGIMADLVEDIRTIRGEDIVSLEYPVLGENNSYLAGAVHLETMEPPVLYTLDMAGLYKKMTRHEPDYWY